MKAAFAAGLALLLIAGSITAFVLYRLHEGRDVRGSSTVEFVTTTVAPPPVKRGNPIVWTMFGFDPARLHVAPATQLRPPFRRIWRAGGSSLLEFPPAIAYGRLYLANGSGVVFALSTRTGARAWAFATSRCVAASPAVGDFGHGTVYEAFLNHRPCNSTRAGDGEVVALQVGNGRVRWRRHIGASETSPLLVGKRLYVGDWLGKVYALDAATGRIRWTFQADGAIKAGLALSGGRVYAGSYGGHVYALDARTGHLAWRAAGDPRLFGRGRFYSTPAAAYGRVYIGCTDGKVYSFGAASGKRRWSHSTGGYVYGSPAVWHRLVLIGSYDHHFYAFDAATGAERWRFAANGPISGSATVIDGVVYFATLSGRTYALRAATGRLLWSYPDGKYSPVVTDGHRLYLVGYATVYGFGRR